MLGEEYRAHAADPDASLYTIPGEIHALSDSQRTAFPTERAGTLPALVGGRPRDGAVRRSRPGDYNNRPAQGGDECSPPWDEETFQHGVAGVRGGL